MESNEKVQYQPFEKEYHHQVFELVLVAVVVEAFATVVESNVVNHGAVAIVAVEAFADESAVESAVAHSVGCYHC